MNDTAKATRRKDTDGIDEMRDRFKKAKEYWQPKFDECLADIKFVVVPGHQWDDKLKKRRGNRPTYEFPKLRMHTQQVINEMRQTRPQGKVRGVEESDRGLAELMQGICRNIEATSDADTAHDIAFEPAVQGGFGAWRICTDYANDDDFDLDIIIEPICNPFSVFFQPAANKIDRRDAEWCFVLDRIAKAQFEREHPGASVSDFDQDAACADWRDRDLIQRAEYWYKKPMKRELLAIKGPTGQLEVVFSDDAKLDDATAGRLGIQIMRRRVVNSHKVYMRLTNGHEWLSEPYEFPSKFIPIIVCWGNIQNIDGDDYFSGMVRYAKDGQRLHNVHRTAAVEAVAKAPKAPFIATPEQIAGLESMWNAANAEDRPYLLYKNVDGLPAPQRTRQAEVPAALIQLAGMDNDDMKAATGQYDASLGARSNETSGIAINSRKQQGATATFNYIDNLVRSIRYEYQILVDMIPRVYDTPRVVRVLGDDGGEKWRQLYQTVEDPESGQQITLNDISKGKYDVAVTVGPSYATQRMEAVEAFTQLAGQLGSSFPAIAPLVAYQVIKNLDLPGSDEVENALRKTLVEQGIMPPREGEEPPPAPPPDPRLQATVDKMIADADKARAAARQSNANAAKTEAETPTVQPLAEADYAKTMSEVAASQIVGLTRAGRIGQAMGLPPDQAFTLDEPEPAQAGFAASGAPEFTG
ncbi:portal protein [Lysobacter enzymogenes]|uniref:portal protein n=1 Tax=Lysobacter enzymogenes TaxID=69 RepID=UPI00089AD40E|nr:portal protein [Lysobacter enzymogenes]SDX52730.1 Phage P22-like portal protein [Lysobacter enzymogenes]